MTKFLRVQLKSISEYNWLGHNIKIHTHASAKFLWLDKKLDVFVNDKKVKHLKTRSFTQSSTKFAIPHQGQNLKGQIISKGLPFTPAFAQSIIIDDTIVDKNKILDGKGLFSSSLLSSLFIGYRL